MNHESRLTPREQGQELDAAAAQLGQSAEARTGPLVFDTVEEALRHDRHRVPVPDAVAARIAEALPPDSPAASRTWWQRLLGR